MGSINVNYFGMVYGKDIWNSIWFVCNCIVTRLGVLSISSRLGNMAGTIVLSSLMKGGIIDWRGIFWLSAAFGAIVIVIDVILLWNSYDTKFTFACKPTKQEEEEHKPKTDEKVHQLDNASNWEAIKYFFSSKLFWTITLSQICLTVVSEINSFFPMYMRDAKKLSSSDAALSSSLFAAGSAVGVITGGFIYDRIIYFNWGRFIYCSVTMTIGTLCCVLFWVWQSMPVYLTVIVACIAGMMIAPSYYIPMSVFSVAVSTINMQLIFLVCRKEALRKIERTFGCHGLQRSHDI